MCPKIPMLGVWKPSIQVSSKHLFWSDFHLSMPQKDPVSIMQRFLNSSFAYFNATFAASLTRAKSWGFTYTKMKHFFIYEEGMPKTLVSQPACDKLISISQDNFRGSVVLPSVVTQLWESNTRQILHFSICLDIFASWKHRDLSLKIKYTCVKTKNRKLHVPTFIRCPPQSFTKRIFLVDSPSSRELRR